MSGKEQMAYAKLATRDDLLGPFYIDDNYIKERDENGNPLLIEVTLGRTPQQGSHKEMFDSDFQIGSRMKISKKHAKIYWSHEQKTFEIKSICKNAVKAAATSGRNMDTYTMPVSGVVYPGSPDGTTGKPATLESQDKIEIADATPLYFLLPKGKAPAAEKPKLTYEQLIISALEPDKQLTLNELIARIQEKYPYYNDENLQDTATWKGSLRTTLNTKIKVFEKTTKVEGSKKVMYWNLKKTDDDSMTAAMDTSANSGAGGVGELATPGEGIAMSPATPGMGLGLAPGVSQTGTPGGLAAADAPSQDPIDLT